MPIYARSDVSHVAVSSGHGGCGNSHSRPVVHGAPAKVWELQCLLCEDFLRSDPLWSSLPGGVPETPDEKASREASESRSQLDLEKSNAEAFTQLANAVSGNAMAMGKLVELMAILAPAQEKVSGNGPVQGEVLSRAHEVENASPPPPAPAEKAAPPPPSPPSPVVKDEAPAPVQEPKSDSGSKQESPLPPRRGRPPKTGKD